MTWLMTQESIDLFEKLRVSASATDKGWNVEAARHIPAPVEISRGIASVQIKGPLLDEPSFFLDLFGVPYTLYSDIRNQSLDAVKNGAKRIDYFADSPGGTSNGLLPTMKLIRDLPVKTKTIAGNQLCSAMYMLASQTGGIYAQDDLSMVGSVGVAIDTYYSGDEISISNTDSPKKRPNMGTEDGQSAVREVLDDIYDVIAEVVAEGRGVTPETVKNEYGQGAVMTARTALKMKMIDGIIDNNEKNANAKTAEAQNEERIEMNVEDLKREHPDLYREVVEDERSRVRAHLKLAEASGDVSAAHRDISAGRPVDQEVQAHHIAAAMKMAAINARQAESAETVDVTSAAPGTENAGMQMKRLIEAACPGIKWEVL